MSNTSTSKAGAPRGLARFLPERLRKRKPLVPVIRINGAIGMAMPLRPGVSLASLAPVLEKAFSTKGARAVAISINSPGGAPVQSRLIYQRIRSLAEENGVPVYVFCEDVAASGGYMLALAGDEIYADLSSIIGSIGVISAGFGFNKLIEKAGIDRRVYTAGKNKLSLDPFQPEKAEDVKRLKAIQEDVHEVFKDMVRQRRAGKLDGKEDRIFSGEFWSGRGAMDLGLVDDLGDLRTVMRQKFGEEVKLKVIGGEKGWLRRRLAFARAGGREPSLPGGWADDLIAAVEQRALWSRFGL